MHELLKDATEEQRAAIQHDGGAAFVSAAPGSGKCIDKRSFVPTDKGLLRIEQIPELYPVQDNLCAANVRGGNEGLTQFGTRATSHWFDMGRAPALRATTDSGYALTGTHEHPIVVLGTDGDLQFKTLADVAVGDVAAIARSTNLWGPQEMDLDVAYVLGMLVGDGTLSLRGGNFGLCRNHEAMAEIFRRVLRTQFGVERVVAYQKKESNSVTHSVSSVHAKRALAELDVAMVRSPLRYVPQTIMQGTRPVVVSFLQGLFDTESHVSLHNWEYTTASGRLAREVQALLLNLGVRTAFAKKPVKAYPDNNYYRLQTSGESLRRFSRIGLLREHEGKLERLRTVVAREHNPNKDLVTGQATRLRRLRDTYWRHLPNYEGKIGAITFPDGTKTRLARYLNGKRTPSRQMVKRLLQYVPEQDQDRQYLEMLAGRFILDPITKVDDVGKRHVYDFTVPDGHSFVANGFVNHNTRVITYRCAYLIDQGADPAGIIGITFTNKAANEMKERVKQLVESRLAKRLTLSTFHSFCARLMRNSSSLYGVRRDFNIADEADSKQLVTLAMSRVTGKPEKHIKSLSGAGDPQHVRKWISDKKNRLLTPTGVESLIADDEHAVRFPRFNRFYQDYEHLLQESNLVDFDDLILKTVLGLQRAPEEQKSFGRHLQYLMVDEWQDTNYAQFELVRLLSHLRQNVFTVGDDDQSIYGWRGAEAANTDRYYATFDDVKTYYLQRNFRSVPGIAAAANLVICNNRRQHDKKIIPHKQGGEIPRLVETDNREHEARVVMGTIRDMVKQGKGDWKDFAIIYRIRSWSRALEDAAVARNIPHKVIGSLSFYNRKVIKDILAYCRLLISPSDNAAFTRVYNVPPRHIGPSNFAKFAAVAAEHEFSLMKTMRKGLYAGKVLANAQQGFRQLKSLYKSLRAVGPDEVYPVIQRILRYSGYRDYAERIKDEDRRARVLEDLDELQNAAATFDNTHRKHKRKGIERFLEHTALMQQDDKDDEDRNKVLLMTAHAAKGLEFANVFVCGAVEGVVPLLPRSDDGESAVSPEQARRHYEEERRVFYVAMTRAEERLWITYPNKRMIGGSVQPCDPSRFIQEAGETLQFINNSRTASRNPLRRNGGMVPPTRRPGKKTLTIPDGGADEVMRMRRSRSPNDRDARRQELKRRNSE